MSKITLDAETFKALASEARLRVLKALDERRKTLAEISRDLGLNKATVHEHLQLLTAAGLTRKRDDEGRKWIYYELTWTGARILHPEATTTFNVLLGLSIAAAGGGIVTLGRAAGWWLADRSNGGDGAGDGGPDTLNNGPESASSADDQDAADRQALQAPSEGAMDDGGSGSDASFLDDGGIFALALIACVVLFLALAWMLRRKVSPKPLDEASAAAAERAPVG